MGNLGPFALYLMTIKVLTALVFTQVRIGRLNWRNLHRLNYVVFIFGLSHSFTIGSDTRGLLMPIWLFYLLLFMAGVIYQVKNCGRIPLSRLKIKEIISRFKKGQ